MSTLIALTIALPMMRLGVSPIPIGLTPGHLSRATRRRQATNADRLRGSTKQVHRRLAVTAIASHKSVDVDLNDVHMHFHAAAFSPEGPAEPSVLRAVLRIKCPSIISKKIGYGSLVGVVGVTIDDCLYGC